MFGFRLLRQRTLDKMLYEAAYNGFKLGKVLAEVDKTKKGIIVAARVNQQINDIMDIIERGEA